MRLVPFANLDRSLQHCESQDAEREFLLKYLESIHLLKYSIALFHWVGLLELWCNLIAYDTKILVGRTDAPTPTVSEIHKLCLSP